MANPAGDEPKSDSGREKPPKGSFHSVAKGIERITKFRKYLNDIFPPFPMGTDRGQTHSVLRIRYLEHEGHKFTSRDYWEDDTRQLQNAYHRIWHRVSINNKYQFCFLFPQD